MDSRKQRGLGQSGSVSSSYVLVLVVAVGALVPMLALGDSFSSSIGGVVEDSLQGRPPTVRGTSQAGSALVSRALRLASSATETLGDRMLGVSRRISKRLEAPASGAINQEEAITNGAAALAKGSGGQSNAFTSPDCFRSFIERTSRLDSDARRALFPSIHRVMREADGDLEKHGLTVARQLDKPEEQSVMLAWFASRTNAEELYLEALDTVAQIEGESHRKATLVEIASTQPSGPIWKELLERGKQLLPIADGDDFYYRTALVEFAEFNPPTEARVSIVDAIDSLARPASRTEAWTGFAAANADDIGAWQRAIESTRDIETKFERSSGLEKIAKASPPETAWPLLFDELETFGEGERSATLAAIIRNGLPESQGERVIRTAQELGEPDARARTFVALARHNDARFWSEALDAIDQIADSERRGMWVVSAAKADVPAELEARTLSATRRIEDPSKRIEALAALGARGEASAWDDALLAVRGLEDEQHVDRALSLLARSNPPTRSWDDLLAVATQRLSGYTLSDTLKVFARSGVPEAMWPKLLDVVDQLDNWHLRRSTRDGLMRADVPHEYWDRLLSSPLTDPPPAR